MKKVALVTGASSGIGQACALGLLNEGWQVVLVGRRTEALQETLAKAGTNAANGIVMSADVSDEAQVKALFDQVRRQCGRLDLLFNNAGISLATTLPGDVSGDDWRRMVDVNLNGAFYCLSHAFKLMQEQSPQGGRIINNGSISATTPRPFSIAYTSTKHAVSGLTKTASLDGRQYDIAVGQIDVGNAATPMAMKMAKGVPQANLEIKAEPLMDVALVGTSVVYMASLPLEANVMFHTVMATKMPFAGRG